jgi:hypothetical protein
MTIRTVSLLVVVVLLLLGQPLAAVADDDVMTGRYLNGRAWQLLDAGGKMVYVTAYQEGYGMALLNWLTTAKGKQTGEEMERQERHYMADGAFTTDDIIQQLNTFFSEPSNLSLPVPFAHMYVIRKFRGATIKELSEFKARLQEEAKVLRETK